MRLTPKLWVEIRKKWEAGATNSQLAREYPVTPQAVGKKAKAEGWERKAEPFALPGEVEKEVERFEQAKPEREAMRQELQAQPDASAFKLSNAFMVDRTLSGPAKVLLRHRYEWDDHRVLIDQAIMTQDLEMAKLAKVTAETLAIRQKAERAAWGLDVSNKPADDIADEGTVIDMVATPDLDALEADELVRLSELAEKVGRLPVRGA